MRTAVEDSEDKKARETERKKAESERRRAAQRNAASLTSDLSKVYGTRGLSMFDLR